MRPPARAWPGCCARRGEFIAPRYLQIHFGCDMPPTVEQRHRWAVWPIEHISPKVSHGIISWFGHSASSAEAPANIIDGSHWPWEQPT
jgi:hypothetical protein